MSKLLDENLYDRTVIPKNKLIIKFENNDIFGYSPNQKNAIWKTVRWRLSDTVASLVELTLQDIAGVSEISSSVKLDLW